MTWQGEKGLLLNRAPVVGGDGGRGDFSPRFVWGTGRSLSSFPFPWGSQPRIEFAIPPPPPPHPPYPGIEFISGEKGTPHPCPMGGGGGRCHSPPSSTLPRERVFFQNLHALSHPPPSPDRACFGSGGVQPPVTYARHRVHRCIDGVGIILFPLATQPPTPGRLCSEPHGNPLPPSTGGRGFPPSPPPPLPPPPPPLPSPGTLRAWMFRARSSPPPYPTPGSSLFFGDGGVDPGPRSEFIFSGYEKVHTGTASVSPSRGHGGKRRLFTRAGGRNHPSTPIPPPDHRSPI